MLFSLLNNEHCSKQLKTLPYSSSYILHTVSCLCMNVLMQHGIVSCVLVWLRAANSRNIAVPMELENQLYALFAKSQTVQKHSKLWMLSAARGRVDTILSQDYRNIVEGLHVRNTSNCRSGSGSSSSSKFPKFWLTPLPLTFFKCTCT